MDSRPRPTFAYLRFLEAEISQFLNILQVRLNEVEVVQQEIQEVQSFLIECEADLDILQQNGQAVTYLLEQQWAILQLTCIASNLLAVVQALLFSGNETSELPSLIHELSIIGTCNTSVPATMVTDNRFSVLADSKVFDDCEEPSTSREAVSKVDVEEYSKIECQQADDHPQSGQNSQDGWGDDITIDEDGEAVYMDPREGDRRRKVSQGPRPGGNKGVSLGFPYEFTNSSQLRHPCYMP
jgi:hypothetical protein